jgi:glycosyltransferase involved in cell wall biosynthesis
MKLNWLGYWPGHDGYGRFNIRFVQALQRAGADVRALHIGDLDRPPWLLEQMAMDWERLTITCAPPYMLKPVPGRQWLFSMTEGSVLPDKWVDTINGSGVERVLVPCQHNAGAFRNSGVEAPIHVVPGGTDPEEFPLRSWEREEDKPYTFLTIADRNERKGWHEVWEAFYLAFGGKTDGVQDVRLIIKYLPSDNVADVMAKAQGSDKRILYQNEVADDMASVYAQADCLALPSRCEGWGMIQREAAMSGLPVITQAHAGLDDGHTHEWAIVVETGQMQPIPRERHTTLGEWRIANVEELAGVMQWCYDNPDAAKRWHGDRAAAWLRANQTWDHAVETLMGLIRQQEPELFLTGEIDYALWTGRPTLRISGC